MWQFVKSLFKFIKEILSFLTISLNKITHELDKFNQAYHEKHSHDGTLDDVVDYAISANTHVNLNKTQLLELQANNKAGLCYKKPKEEYYQWCIGKNNDFFNISVLNGLLIAIKAKKFSTVEELRENDPELFYNNLYK